MRLVVVSLGLLRSAGACVCACVCVLSMGAFGFSDWHIQRVFWGGPCSSHCKAKKLESSLARGFAHLFVERTSKRGDKTNKTKRKKKKIQPASPRAAQSRAHMYASFKARARVPPLGVSFSSSAATLKWIPVSWQQKPRHLSILLSDRAKRSTHTHTHTPARVCRGTARANTGIYGFRGASPGARGCESLENVNHMGAPGARPAEREQAGICWHRPATHTRTYAHTHTAIF